VSKLSLSASPLANSAFVASADKSASPSIDTKSTTLGVGNKVAASTDPKNGRQLVQADTAKQPTFLLDKHNKYYYDITLAQSLVSERLSMVILESMPFQYQWLLAHLVNFDR
jgi:hypothetical protein